jgi:hypothetical protein
MMNFSQKKATNIQNIIIWKTTKSKHLPQTRKLQLRCSLLKGFMIGSHDILLCIKAKSFLASMLQVTGSTWVSEREGSNPISGGESNSTHSHV